ncbi:capsid cement protein [Castellaniella caeni]|uniref:capsid cement protein n=1 Tax=Castellaniella caeni TaxID=266123 RepID=UPI000C9F8B49|nr:capsid cement protein [Castellaniella caeni]
MTQKICLLSLPLLAAGPIAAYTCVGADGKTAAAGADAQGVAIFDAAAGDLVTTDVLGTTIVRAASAVTGGGRVQVGADGGVAPVTTGIPVGRALEAADAGALVEMFIFQGAQAA